MYWKIKMKKYGLSILALCISLGVFSCYTFSGTTLPGHLKTITINPVINQTLDPILAENLTQELIKGFQSRSSLRQVNSGGHSELTVTLTSFTRSPYTTSGAAVTNYQINLAATVKFYDHVKGQMIYEENKLPGFAIFDINAGETEAQGNAKAVSEMVKIILDNTVSGW
jgi:Lipopolysaccharide-assembly